MDTYYKKIIYKKNAFEDLKTYVKLNFNRKNILLVSTKNIQTEDVTNLLNSLFCGSENVAHYVCRDHFSINELDEINKKINNGQYSLIVAFGGGNFNATRGSYRYYLPRYPIYSSITMEQFINMVN